MSHTDHLEEFSWLGVKEHSHKKLDIAWRLRHGALPLGYRTRHVDAESNGNCPWCVEERQTTEHFAINCTLSKEIWQIAYNMLNVTVDTKPPATVGSW